MGCLKDHINVIKLELIQTISVRAIRFCKHETFYTQKSRVNMNKIFGVHTS